MEINWKSGLIMLAILGVFAAWAGTCDDRRIREVVETTDPTILYKVVGEGVLSYGANKGPVYFIHRPDGRCVAVARFDAGRSAYAAYLGEAPCPAGN